MGTEWLKDGRTYTFRQTRFERKTYESWIFEKQLCVATQSSVANFATT
jgi:hypothetical protein